MVTSPRTRSGTRIARDARGPTASVVPAEPDRPQLECLHEVEQVLTDRGLLRHPWCGRIEEPRGPVAAQVRNQHPIPGGRERRRHAVERACVVGESVEQNYWEGSRVTVGLVGDLQLG